MLKGVRSLPTCQNCGEKWTWKQTIKTLFKLKCPHCHVKQYESASSRKQGAIFGLIPLILLPIIIGFEFTMSTTLIFAVVLVILIFALYPFILKLSNQQEPYW